MAVDRGECKICGATFEYERARKAREICSDACRITARRQRQAKYAKRYYKENRESVLAKNAERTRKPKTEVKADCVICEAEFTYLFPCSGAAPNVCSAACKAERRKRSSRTHAKLSKARRRGEVAAQNRRYREEGRYLTEVPCTACGRPVVRKVHLLNSGVKPYCSVQCRYPEGRAPRRTFNSGPKRECLRCQVLFHLGSHDDGFTSAVRYCSNKCASSAARSRRRELSKLAGKAPNAATRLRVFERDGWVCYLCHEVTDRSPRALHRDRPTIDHVMPLVRGGTHDESNLRCAHHRCNSAKSGRLT